MPLISRSSLHEKINFLSLLLIAFSLPFHILFCSYAIALFVINQLLEGNIIIKIKKAVRNKFILIFISFFLLHIAGLAFTENIQEGLFDLEKKVSLLIFPLLLFSTQLKQEQLKSILISFVASCLTLAIILLSVAFYNFIITGNDEYFILEHLTAPTGIHRVYVSMYFLFSIYIIVYLKNRDFFRFKNSKILLNLLIVLFTILIFLLASRTIVGLTFLSFIVITIYTIRKTKKIAKGVSTMILFLVFSGSFLVYNNWFRDIMSQTYQSLDMGNSEFNQTGPNQRLEIWKAAAGVLQENYFGVGTGDTEDVLYSQYQTNEFTWGIKYRFNAHNQYLQTFIGLGWIGFITLFICLAWPAFFAYQNRYFLYLGLLILFSLSCLTESMLCAQKGIVFYAFFNSLLLFHYPDKNS